MYFRSIITSASALVALALAQSELKFTNAPSAVQAGKQYKLEWTGGSGSPATIVLRKGSSNNLKTLQTVTESATGNSFQWSVDSSLETDNDYALQITEGKETNYWAVSVAGGAAAVSSLSSSASSSVSSSSTKSAASSSSSASASSSKSASSSSSAASSSATGSSSSSRNSTTVSSATLHSTRTSSGSASSSTDDASSTSSSSSSSSSAAASAPASDGTQMKSNAALVLGAVAAIAYLG